MIVEVKLNQFIDLLISFAKLDLPIFIKQKKHISDYRTLFNGFNLNQMSISAELGEDSWILQSEQTK